MPELPEVETIRRTLLPKVTGAVITEVEVRERRLRRPVSPDFERALLHRRVHGIGRLGKYLLFDLGGDERLLVHLGMSGSLELKPKGAPAELHDHVRLGIDGGRVLVFNDPRRFGLLRFAKLDSLAELTTIGPDPLTESWTAERLRSLLGNRQRPIKSALMDQMLIAGIGNIYANEICFRAGVRPSRRSRSLRRKELEALAAAIPSVLSEAVRLGGSSISDFRDGNGQRGSFQLRFRVYDRAGEPCSKCGTRIRRIVLSGRSSFYCRSCQT